jgi:hypothetical protein
METLLPRLLFVPVAIVLLSKFFLGLQGHRSPSIGCLTNISTVLTLLEELLAVLPMAIPVFGTKSMFSPAPRIYISPLLFEPN